MMPKPATKIIATIGPATSNAKAISGLLKEGVSIFRLNFSHGSFEIHGTIIELIRQISRRLEIPVGIMQDLPGPKIRVGEIPGNGIELRIGQEITLDCGKKSESPQNIPVQYNLFCRDVRMGNTIYMNDGAIRLKALKVQGTKVRCLVEAGGLITSHKGINLPGTKISTSSLTPYDRKCVKFGIERKVDFMAMSFVRSGDDVTRLRKLINSLGGNQFIIAKIEKQEAIERIDEILKATDGIMVARGDLGIEIPIAKVPVLQKELIGRCNHVGVPVITATQVLESMINSPRPTRAEATDAANAVLDGSDALMLSGETAVGLYPLEAVKTLSGILLETEKSRKPVFHRRGEGQRRPEVAACLARAVCESAHDLEIQVIATPTRSGHTARLISRFRPKAKIVAFSEHESTLAHLLLSWGVETLPVNQNLTMDKLVLEIKRLLLKNSLAQKGQRIIVTAGSPGSRAGETNLMMVESI